MEYMLTIILIVGALSLDSLSASFAYGSGGIKIPVKSILIINVIGVVLFGTSLYLGYLLRPWLSETAVHVISAGILIVLGSIKIFESAIKNFIRKRKIDSNVQFSLFNLNFILNIYADPLEADADQSRVISSREAFFLAVAISLDNMVVGLGAGLIMSPGPILLIYLLINFLCLFFGVKLGNKIAKEIKYDLSWLGGVILILIAFV